MKKIFFLTYLISLYSCAQDNKWKMVWNDEFNYTGLPDSTKWTAETLVATDGAIMNCNIIRQEEKKMQE